MVEGGDVFDEGSLRGDDTGSNDGSDEDSNGNDRLDTNDTESQSGGEAFENLEGYQMLPVFDMDSDNDEPVSGLAQECLLPDVPAPNWLKQDVVIVLYSFNLNPGPTRDIPPGQRAIDFFSLL